MDDSVIRAMVQWPNVPDCYGWLSLSRRGDWLLKGERVTHPKLQDFIARNYLRHDSGSYIFQNGPQRVHLALEYCPYVLQLADTSSDRPQLVSQTGETWGTPENFWLDNNGQFLVSRQHQDQFQCGLLDDRDAHLLLPLLIGAAGKSLADDQLSAELEAFLQKPHDRLALQWGEQLFAIAAIDSTDVPTKFGFTPNPTNPNSEKKA